MENININEVRRKHAFRLYVRTIVALMYLVCITSVVSAGQETRLTNVTPLVQCTAIFGNYVTWYDTATNNVNVYDLTKGVMLAIPNNDAESGNIPIYGSKIVWHDFGDNITMYDISTNKMIQISTSGYSPDIYGNYIVYEKSYKNEYDPYTYYNSLYLYDISTNKETQITDNSTSYYYIPVIYGNKIAWSTTDSNSKTSIYVYDIPTRQISNVSTSGTASSPDIYGNIIVWSETYNGQSSIYMRDISTHKTTQITNTGTARNPSIYGNRVVYEYSNRMSDVYVGNIYLYDISTGQTTQITNCGCASCPSIYNDKIVYEDSHAYGINNYEVGSIYLYDLSAEPVKPTATFTADKTYGEAPLQVQFTSNTTGDPSEYFWVFEPQTSSDWNSHHAVTAVHTFLNPGVYNISLTVNNSVGSTTVTKNNYITVTTPGVKPVANFYSSVGNNILSDTENISIQQGDIVSFFDTSVGSPTAWKWDFGDGATSIEQNNTHIYSSVGNYIVNLTVSNAIGIDSKTAKINVQSQSSFDDGSSSNGGGGGAGGSPEPQSNVEAKELSQTFISSGKPVKFDFPQKATPLANICFDSKKTTGKTTTIVEMLKRKSSLVPNLPSGEVYKSLNIWVGNGGFGDSDNIRNAVVNFAVKKSWVKDNSIDQSSIVLNRYSNNKWNQLPTTLFGEDDNYLYFTAQTPGFSPYAITGMTTTKGSIQPESGDKTQNLNRNETQAKSENESKAIINEQTKSSNTSGKESKKTPGFEIIYGIACLFYFYNKNKIRN